MNSRQPHESRTTYRPQSWRAWPGRAYRGRHGRRIDGAPVSQGVPPHVRTPIRKLVPIGDVGDPRAVVERAIEESRKLKRDPPAGRDSVWAMFDRDIHPRFAESKNLAHGNGISLAISNPCFELWGILHYQDQDAHLDRHECQRLLRYLCPGYRKSGAKVFDDRTAIEKGYLDAVKRAEKSLERRTEEGIPGGNPSTSVHLVTEQIRLGVDQGKRKK